MTAAHAQEKTFHRWTPEEDEKLLAEVEKSRAALESIGKPGGMTRDLFWGQIPGKIGVLTTPVGCSMRYRTLTSDTEWARKRRGVAAPAADDRAAMERVHGELVEIKRALKDLLAVWTSH